MNDLVVRAYNIGFGDALLISLPDRGPDGRETMRHLLIDVGNLLVGADNQDDVFKEVVRDIHDRTDGQVDLYVMTHEHLDHVQGLLSAKNQGVDLGARCAWLTGSASPDYYATHEAARVQRLALEETMRDVHRLQQLSSDPWLAMMVLNNSMLLGGGLALSTADYVDHVRTIAPAAATHYVDRLTDLEGKHPFKEARLRILAPEEDTSLYYRRVRATPSLTMAPSGPTPTAAASSRPLASLPPPPPGVEPGPFYDLVSARNQDVRTKILEIDQANNNTSVVLEIEWSGWRLLFPGDAEIGSWRRMHAADLLRPVNFVKVAHHGSHNGTYEGQFDVILPAVSHNGRERHAIVSTHIGDWKSVPDEMTLGLYSSRATLHDTRDVPRGSSVEVRFPRVDG